MEQLADDTATTTGFSFRHEARLRLRGPLRGFFDGVFDTVTRRDGERRTFLSQQLFLSTGPCCNCFYRTFGSGNNDAVVLIRTLVVCLLVKRRPSERALTSPRVGELHEKMCLNTSVQGFFCSLGGFTHTHFSRVCPHILRSHVCRSVSLWDGGSVFGRWLYFFYSLKCGPSPVWRVAGTRARRLPGSVLPEVRKRPKLPSWSGGEMAMAAPPRCARLFALLQTLSLCVPVQVCVVQGAPGHNRLGVAETPLPAKSQGRTGDYTFTCAGVV